MVPGRNHYFHIDPEEALFPILEGSSDLAQLLFAWEVIWGQLELAHFPHHNDSVTEEQKTLLLTESWDSIARVTQEQESRSREVEEGETETASAILSRTYTEKKNLNTLVDPSTPWRACQSDIFGENTAHITSTPQAPILPQVDPRVPEPAGIYVAPALRGAQLSLGGGQQPLLLVEVRAILPQATVRNLVLSINSDLIHFLKIIHTKGRRETVGEIHQMICQMAEVEAATVVAVEVDKVLQAQEGLQGHQGQKDQLGRKETQDRLDLQAVEEAMEAMALQILTNQHLWDLPTWDGNHETAIKYFWDVLQKAVLGSNIPQALGYWLGSRSTAIKVLYLGCTWQHKMNRVYETQ
ncbi:hypothetical protein B0H10DRAFT_1959052 [Mycena sp. CBHHK59/15]|nr:hypothetical protein B0H10DRAFT_1959052 [Mycena sp. CBHHK59/15]